MNIPAANIAELLAHLRQERSTEREPSLQSLTWPTDRARRKREKNTSRNYTFAKSATIIYKEVAKELTQGNACLADSMNCIVHTKSDLKNEHMYGKPSPHVKQSV